MKISSLLKPTVLILMKTNKLISVGVDPGAKNGAIAIIDEDLNIIYLNKAPFYITENKSRKLKPKLNKATGKYEDDYGKDAWTDFTKLREIYLPIIKKGNDIIYTIEKVATRPSEGEKTSFKFGDSVGVHKGQFSLLNPVAFYHPLPSIWKKEFNLSHDKSGSLAEAERLFKVNLKDYLKKGKLDDIAEALLLAFYGLGKYIRENNLIDGE